MKLLFFIFALIAIIFAAPLADDDPITGNTNERIPPEELAARQCKIHYEICVAHEYRRCDRPPCDHFCRHETCKWNKLCKWHIKCDD